MENLAGVYTERSNHVVLNELSQAYVPVVEVKFNKGRVPEVKATIVGVLHFADGTLAVFSRNWYYWSVLITKTLPRKEANALNYLMGDVVRVDGYSGGKNVERGGCNHWHVDTQEGLNTLTYILKRKFGDLSKEQAPDVATLAKLGLLNDAFYG